MARLKISSVNRDTGKSKRIVTFELKSGEVKASWASEDAEMFHADELETIITAKGSFKPQDGKKYFDALQLAYAQSSNIIVENL